MKGKSAYKIMFSCLITKPCIQFNLKYIGYVSLLLIFFSYFDLYFRVMIRTL